MRRRRRAARLLPVQVPRRLHEAAVVIVVYGAGDPSRGVFAFVRQLPRVFANTRCVYFESRMPRLGWLDAPNVSPGAQAVPFLSLAGWACRPAFIESGTAGEAAMLALAEVTATFSLAFVGRCLDTLEGLEEARRLVRSRPEFILREMRGENLLDALGHMPGRSVENADATGAYTQSPMEGDLHVQTWITIEPDVIDYLGEVPAHVRHEHLGGVRRNYGPINVVKVKNFR